LEFLIHGFINEGGSVKEEVRQQSILPIGRRVDVRDLFQRTQRLIVGSYGSFIFALKDSSWNTHFICKIAAKPMIAEPL